MIKPGLICYTYVVVLKAFCLILSLLFTRLQVDNAPIMKGRKSFFKL